MESDINSEKRIWLLIGINVFISAFAINYLNKHFYFTVVSRGLIALLTTSVAILSLAFIFFTGDRAWF